VSRRVFELAVRPDAFSALHGREQVAALLELAGVPVVRLADILAAGAPRIIEQYADTLAGQREEDAGEAVAAYLATQRRVETDRHAARQGLETARGALDAARGDAAGLAFDEAGYEAAKGRLVGLRGEQRDARQLEESEGAEHRGRLMEIGRQIAVHRAALGRLQQARAEAAGRKGAASSAPTGEDLAERRARVTAALEEVRAATVGVSPATVAQQLSRLKGVRDDRGEIEVELARVRVGRADAIERLPEIQAQRAAAEAAADAGRDAGAPNADLVELRARRAVAGWEPGDLCPKCYQDVDHELNNEILAELEERCATAEAEQERRQQARALVDQLDREIERLRMLSDDLGVKLLEGELEQCDQATRIRGALALCKRVEELERELRGIDREVEELAGQEGAASGAPTGEVHQAEVDRLSEALAEIGEWSSPYGPRLAQVGIDIEAHEAEIERLEQTRERVGMVGRREREMATAGERHEALDALVRALQGPVRKCLFDDRLTSLDTQLQRAMARIGVVAEGDDYHGVYDATVRMDERGRLDLRLVRYGEHADAVPSPQPSPEGRGGSAGGGGTSGAFEVPFECCSDSERVRLVWALQCIAARRTGLLVLDAPEALDERFTYAVYDLGQDLGEHGVQVIVCAIAPPAGLERDGWGLVRLEDGAVVLVREGVMNVAPTGEAVAEGVAA